jgi:hypothetical protein
MTSAEVAITCATEVFIATALLHREQPGRSDFTIQEIASRAAKENITGEFRSGINVHASQHCVANRTPNPGRHRMLFATGKHTRRLFLPGDETHEGRTGKIFPEPEELPSRYLPLLEWARRRFGQGPRNRGSKRSSESPAPSHSAIHAHESTERWLESLFELEGLGKEHWKNVDPDEFVRKLREGWE